MQEKEILDIAIKEVRDELFRSEIEKKKSEIRESLKHKIRLDGGFSRHNSNPLIAIDGLKTRIEYCSRNIVFKVPVGHKAKVISSWSGVIGAPSLVDYKDVSFDDYYHFPSINETVFIPENKIWTIEEHLEAIRKAQQPLQDEILRSDRFKEIQSTKLQLVGLS